MHAAAALGSLERMHSRMCLAETACPSTSRSWEKSKSGTWPIRAGLDVVVEIKLRRFRKAREPQDLVFVDVAEHNMWW